MSIKKARKTLQNKEKFNYDILDKVANSGKIQEKSGEKLRKRMKKVVDIYKAF